MASPLEALVAAAEEIALRPMRVNPAEERVEITSHQWRTLRLALGRFQRYGVTDADINEVFAQIDAATSKFSESEARRVM